MFVVVNVLFSNVFRLARCSTLSWRVEQEEKISINLLIY